MSLRQRAKRRVSRCVRGVRLRLAAGFYLLKVVWSRKMFAVMWYGCWTNLPPEGMNCCACEVKVIRWMYHAIGYPPVAMVARSLIMKSWQGLFRWG